ncbi:MAG: MarR family transcriptional regulator [Cyclobacteriaceae bacterium]
MIQEQYATYSFLLDRTARKVKQFAQRRFKELGFEVTVDQWITLKKLGENDSLSQKELAELVSKDTPTLTRIIDLLVEKDLVSRKVDPEDRRRFNVGLTEKGEWMLDEYQSQIRDIRLKAWNGLSEDDFNDFKRIINTIYRNLDE